MFRTRRLDGALPYVFADATDVKARVGSRVVSRAVVVAVTGVTATGNREMLGVDIGDSEDGALWTGFLQSLRARCVLQATIIGRCRLFRSPGRSPCSGMASQIPRDHVRGMRVRP